MSEKIQFRESCGPKMTVLMAGDFCPREKNSDFVARNAEMITAGVKPVFDAADLKILQWETAITRENTPILKQGPNLRCTGECLSFSKSLGINIHLLANNHIGDFGPDAVMETIRHSENAGIRTVGAGRNKAEALKPLIMDCIAGRIGIINVAENEFGIATDETPGAAPFDLTENMDLIQETRKKVAILIVAVHGGHEFNPIPSPRMTKYYRAFAKAGADIVFNCHTHCISGSDVFNQVPIVYSPGNFYFPGSECSLPSWYFGYLSKFYCDRKGCYGFELIPYTFSKSALRLLNLEEKHAFYLYYDAICRIIQDKDMLQHLFEAWCIGKAGSDYLGIINRTHDDNFPPDWNASESVRKWMHVKNDFCCESHNDLLRQFLYLIANGKTDAPRPFIPMLEKFCDPEWMKSIIQKLPEAERC